jgi:hypothetical protein
MRDHVRLRSGVPRSRSVPHVSRVPSGSSLVSRSFCFSGSTSSQVLVLYSPGCTAPSFSFSAHRRLGYDSMLACWLYGFASRVWYYTSQPISVYRRSVHCPVHRMISFVVCHAAYIGIIVHAFEGIDVLCLSIGHLPLINVHSLTTTGEIAHHKQCQKSRYHMHNSLSLSPDEVQALNRSCSLLFFSSIQITIPSLDSSPRPSLLQRQRNAYATSREPLVDLEHVRLGLVSLRTRSHL